MGLILKDLFLTILFALLLSGACLLLLAWLPRSAYARYSLAKPLPLLVLAVCAGTCLYESFCFVGALRVNRYVSGAAQQVESVAARTRSLTEAEITRYVEKEYPALSRFVPAGNDNAVVTCLDYFRSLRRTIRRYAWRRAGWMAGFLVVGAVLLIRDATQQGKRDRALQSMYLDI